MEYLDNATLWQTVPDGFGGFTFSSPIAIKCRWLEVVELIPGSSTILSKAVIYLESDVDVEDYIVKGTHTESSPEAIAGACKIAMFRKIPNLRNLKTIRRAWLV